MNMKTMVRTTAASLALILGACGDDTTPGADTLTTGSGSGDDGVDDGVPTTTAPTTMTTMGMDGSSTGGPSDDTVGPMDSSSSDGGPADSSSSDGGPADSSSSEGGEESSSSSEGGEESSSSSGGGMMDCGNGAIDAPEECDGAALGGANCISIGMGFDGGTLTCAADCTFDTSACTGGGGNSCVGFCGSPDPVPGSSPECFCDDICMGMGDCCADICDPGVCDGDPAICGGGGTCDVAGANCDLADPTACVCTGCDEPQDGVCGVGEDCTCPDCAGEAFCGCTDNGVCNPYAEDCSCADCAGFSACEGQAATCDVSGANCDLADPAACVCTGCDEPQDGVCGVGEDCTCPDCAGEAFCGCADDGVCEPYAEDCSCADCADFAACDAPPGAFTCDDGAIAGCADEDATTCTCEACDAGNGCELSEDCVCPDCAADAFCAAATSCNNDGVCDPYNEGCACADCAEHPLCP